MKDEFSPEELEELLRRRNTQESQHEGEMSLEEHLLSIIGNPNRMSTTKTQIVDKYGAAVISESVEGTVMAQDGSIQDVKYENIPVLDDGTSLTGITRCQNCQGVIKEENMKRCVCGLTVCVRAGCAKYSKSKDQWYCCTSHMIRDSLGLSSR